MALVASVTCRSSTGPIPDEPAPFAPPPPHQPGTSPLLRQVFAEHGDGFGIDADTAGAAAFGRPRGAAARTTTVDPPKVTSAASRSTACRRRLSSCAAGRLFAWVDDEITDADRDWVSVHHPAPVLLHCVEASRGLAYQDPLIITAAIAMRLLHMHPRQGGRGGHA